MAALMAWLCRVWRHRWQPDVEPWARAWCAQAAVAFAWGEHCARCGITRTTHVTTR